MGSKRKGMASGTRDKNLSKDARDLHKAVSELVRVYQFRDRKCICYYDISVTQCYALSVVFRLGPVSLNQVASQLYLDKSTASRVVNSLEKKGYIRRSPDPDDARALRLEVTAKGRDLHKRIIQDLVDEMEALVRDIKPDVRRATAKLIARLAKAAASRFAPIG